MRKIRPKLQYIIYVLEAPWLEMISKVYFSYWSKTYFVLGYPIYYTFLQSLNIWQQWNCFQYVYMHTGNVLHVLNLYTVCAEVMYSMYFWRRLDIFIKEQQGLRGRSQQYLRKVTWRSWLNGTVFDKLDPVMRSSSLLYENIPLFIHYLIGEVRFNGGKTQL